MTGRCYDGHEDKNKNCDFLGSLSAIIKEESATSELDFVL